MSDAVATMGTILLEGVGGRDAVHVAVIAVTATMKVFPGQDVTKSGAPSFGEPTVGIVDPFLKSPVYPGQRYWLFLYPRTITSLRHEWAHPDFAESIVPPTSEAATGVATAASEAWLREFVSRSECPSYEEVLGTAASFVDGTNDDTVGDAYLYFDGVDAHGEIPPEFWFHVERVIGRTTTRPRPTFFTCSC